MKKNIITKIRQSPIMTLVPTIVCIVGMGTIGVLLITRRFSGLWLPIIMVILAFYCMPKKIQSG